MKPTERSPHARVRSNSHAGSTSDDDRQKEHHLQRGEHPDQECHCYEHFGRRLDQPFRNLVAKILQPDHLGLRLQAPSFVSVSTMVSNDAAPLAVPLPVPTAWASCCGNVWVRNVVT